MPWDMSNPLYRWKKRHGKLNKQVSSHKTPSRRKKNVAKRRKRLSRLRSYPRRRYRAFRKGKTPIPLLPTLAVANAALIQPILGNPAKGVAGGLQYFQQGDMQSGLRETIDIIGINFLGYKFSDGSNWWGRTDTGIGPLQTYTTIGIATLGHMLANKFGVNRAMKRIPFLGKYIAL